MTRIVDLLLWKPISFGGVGSINFFAEGAGHTITLGDGIIRISDKSDVALLPFGDNVARATPWVETKPISERPFAKAADILKDRTNAAQKR